jgi:hypothetical protein
MTGAHVPTTIRAVVAAGLGAVLFAAGAGSPAFASDPTPTPGVRTVAGLKASVLHRIDLRLATLRRLDQRVERCRHLTDAHQTTLAGLVDAATGGLTSLRTKVQGETAVDALRADAKSMVDDYRVFILRAPQVHGTCTADNETAAVAKLREVYTKLSAGVAKAKQDGANTATAEQNLASMDQQLDAAESAVAGQAEKLLAIQPGPDGDSIRAQVKAIRQQLKTALQDLRHAIGDAKKVRDFLKSVK